MAAGPTNSLLRAAGIVVTRRKPGHFVALTKDGRLDAYLAQAGVKLPDALERRSAIGVNNVMQGNNDGSSTLLPVSASRASTRTTSPSRCLRPTASRS